MKKSIYLLAALIIIPGVGAFAETNPFQTFFQVQQGAIEGLLGPSIQGPVPEPTLANAKVSNVYSNFMVAIEAVENGEPTDAQVQAILNALNAAAAIMINDPDPVVQKEAAAVLRKAQAKLGVGTGGTGNNGLNPASMAGDDEEEEEQEKDPPPLIEQVKRGDDPEPNAENTDGPVISNPTPTIPTDLIIRQMGIY